MELRVRGDRAVLVDGRHAAGLAPEEFPLNDELAAALHEWARVATAIRATRRDDGSDTETVGVVSRRGHQLAGRVAAELRRPVRYVDPVTGSTVVVVPREPVRRVPRPDEGTRWFRRSPGEPTPWGPGLTVSVMIGAVVLVGMLALTTTIAEAVAGWAALLAASIVSGGMAPSLWLGRNVPTMRWVCFGAAGGLAISWLGVLIVVF
ncbi:DUF2537 domain-containing protein [Thermocrispum agreste]|uniref:DUF2537 domain-containing protein n=1 Tax=Thermocrispum agreste TaxID=37925 RepID=UPI00048E635A